MFRSIPPTPIAALGDEEFLESQLALRFRRAGVPVIRLARGQQEIPCAVVFVVANPDIEIGVDPGAREDVVERGGFDLFKGLADLRLLTIGCCDNSLLNCQRDRARCCCCA